MGAPAAYFSGALTHLYYGPKLPPELVGPGGPIWDKIMPHFITTSGLPEALVLMIVLMVFSASMSSLSSLVLVLVLVLVSSSALAIDIHGAFVDHQEHPRRTVALLCAVFVGLSLVIAIQKPAVIVNLMAVVPVVSLLGPAPDPSVVSAAFGEEAAPARGGEPAPT